MGRLQGRVSTPAPDARSAARIIGVTELTLRNTAWRNAVRLPYLKLGRKVAYDLDALLEWRAARLVQPLATEPAEVA
jgi:hypothetical protein